MSMLQSAAQGVDLSELGISSDQFIQYGMTAAIVILVISLLNCFFGLKLLKVWTALLGLLIGFALGFGISTAFDATTTVALAVGAVAGIALAALGFWLYLAGVFVLCWVLGYGIVLTLTDTRTTLVMIIAVVVGLAIAVIALKFAEPMVILATGVQGGISAASGICTLANIPGTYTYLIIGAVLAILGIVVQFIMESKRKVRLHQKQADKVRAENSTEHEVEKLRAALDHTDKVKEDPDAHDYYDEDDED